MSRPVDDPDYWASRLERAQRSGQLHHAVFVCPLDRWRRIEEAHKKILARHVEPLDWILDAGCGWGRLLDLLPPGWHGLYDGVDLSPDFIALARHLHGGQGRNFSVGDLRSLRAEDGVYDWAILVSIRPMIRREMGDDVWQQVEAELRRVARRILLLEYDEYDPGEVLE